MGNSQGVIRMNISVSRDLKERMDAESRPVNWSGVAARAFEAKLLELASINKGAGTMDEVIARLKAADEMDSKEDYQAGRAAGERWVKVMARPKQLRKLALEFEELDVEEALGAYSASYNKGIAWHLGELIGFDSSIADRGALDIFWGGILGQKFSDGPSERLDGWDYAKGFIEGALDLWEKVEGHLAGSDALRPFVKVLFLAEAPEVAPNRDVVCFPARVDGTPVRCEITADALVKYDDPPRGLKGMTDAKVMLRRFNAARQQIEELACKLIQAGRVGPDQVLKIKRADVPR